MIWYLSVHWKSDRWIDIQQGMIRKYTNVPYRLIGYLNGIDKAHYAKFDHVFSEEDPWHDIKLNRMAEYAVAHGEDSDWIIFIDGDAFPIAPVYERLASDLEQHKLIAVQRLENLGEGQPHPCFCVTTVGLWKQIGGTWKKGYQWINAMGNPDTDVGGELLGLLTKHQIPWLPLRRSNTFNLNTILFGVYGDIVYHHGAGFRGGGCRIIWYERGVYDIYKRSDARILNNIVPRRWQRKVRNSRWHPEGRLKRRIAREIAPLAEQVYMSIRNDPEYVKVFLKALPQQ